MTKRVPFLILLFATLASASAHARREIVSVTDGRMHRGDDPAKPAAGIAGAAQRWGQEDDITVLTVRSVAACA